MYKCLCAQLFLILMLSISKSNREITCSIFFFQYLLLTYRNFSWFQIWYSWTCVSFRVCFQPELHRVWVQQVEGSSDAGWYDPAHHGRYQCQTEGYWTGNVLPIQRNWCGTGNDIWVWHPDISRLKFTMSKKETKLDLMISRTIVWIIGKTPVRIILWCPKRHVSSFNH